MRPKDPESKIRLFKGSSRNSTGGTPEYTNHAVDDSSTRKHVPRPIFLNRDFIKAWLVPRTHRSDLVASDQEPQSRNLSLSDFFSPPAFSTLRKQIMSSKWGVANETQEHSEGVRRWLPSETLQYVIMWRENGLNMLGFVIPNTGVDRGMILR